MQITSQTVPARLSHLQIQLFSLMKFSATVKVVCESSILWISFAYKEREIRQNPYNGKEMNESDITEVYTMMENLSER